MNDDLMSSALAYQALMKIKYHVTIAHRKRLVDLTISFPAEGYHHLAGFQYAGINQLNNRREALNQVLMGKATAAHLQASGTFDKIRNRLQAIAMIPTLMENGKVIFHYRGHEQKWSDIKADYLASMDAEPGKIFFFTTEEKGGEQQPVSIFIRADDSYTRFCPPYKVLEIWKETLADGEKRLIYRSPTYRKET